MIPTAALCNKASGRLEVKWGVGWWLPGTAEAYLAHQNAWLATPCPQRGGAGWHLCGRRALQERGERTEPDVAWTHCIDVASESTWLYCMWFQRGGTWQGLRFQNRSTLWGEENRKGRIQNSRKQLADVVTWCESVWTQQPSLHRACASSQIQSELHCLMYFCFDPTSSPGSHLT